MCVVVVVGAGGGGGEAAVPLRSQRRLPPAQGNEGRRRHHCTIGGQEAMVTCRSEGRRSCHPADLAACLKVSNVAVW
jgi:hypothetical protein